MPLPPLFDPKAKPPKHPINHQDHQPTSSSPKETPAEKKLKKKKKKMKFWKKGLIAIGVLIAVGIISIAGVFAWYSKDLPNPEKINDRSVAESTKIYDRTGTILLYELHGDERRTRVKFEDIPQHVIDATIVTEDRGFYEHSGVDFKSIFRAIVKNILKGNATGEGGSTITQQFIKNAILSPEKKYDRKIKEAILSYQLEKKFDKDEILGMYLNEIPYGSSAYGVEAASNFYFGKSVKDVTLAEAAILAALPQRPSYYSPYGNHTDALFARQQYILDSMAELEKISTKEAEVAKAEKITFANRIENIKAPHFVFYVRDILEEKYPASAIEQGGLKVITTLDIDKQVIAEEAIRLNMDKVEQYGGSNAAMVALDTKTGQIIAMVGSKNYFDTENDGNVNVVLSERQPGSSLKPLVYASAWQKGYTPDTILFDLERDFPIESGTYHPRNYDLTQHGPLQMKKALAGSLNVPAVMTLYLTGIDTVLDNAQKFGYTTFTDRSRYGLSLVLGGAEVKLLEHTNAFATFAREGIYHPTTPILKVEDSSGNVLEEYKEQSEEVFDAEVMRNLNKVLSTDSLRAFIFGAHSKLTLPDRPVAVKTGTTNDYRDAWTMGYTPSLATGVWVGNNDNSEMNKGADGSIIAAPIWNQFMSGALEGTPVEEFKDPEPIKLKTNKPILRGEIDKIEMKKVDKVTGKLIPDSCASTYPSEYVEEREFKQTHTILYYVNKDDPQGEYPKNPQEDPYFSIWENTVKRWASGQEGYIVDDPEYEDCGLRDANKKPTVTITAPKNGTEMSSTTFNIKADITPTNGRNIKEVTYLIDNKVVDTQTSSPFHTDYSPDSLTAGKHTLLIEAKDNFDAKNSQTVSFTFTVEDITSSDIYFVDPSGSATLSSKNFPKTLQLHLGKPTQVDQVKIHYYNTKEANPEHLIIAEKTSGFTSTFSITWPQAPKKGTYKLYAKVTITKGDVIRTNDIPITITD